MGNAQFERPVVFGLPSSQRQTKTKIILCGLCVSSEAGGKKGQELI
jgi:hypothetical protein